MAEYDLNDVTAYTHSLNLEVASFLQGILDPVLQNSLAIPMLHAGLDIDKLPVLPA